MNYNIIYDYKEGNKFYLVFGNKEDFMGPQEKAFNTKKELNDFKKTLLVK